LIALLLAPIPLRGVMSHSEPRGDLQEAVVEMDFSAGDLGLSALPPVLPSWWKPTREAMD
jgi:hypothetical protein